jgi:large subunit ribosomal protein L10
LAFTKKEKQELVAEYENWLKNSQAVFVASYDKMTMKAVDTLRAEVRPTGAHLHVVKNTLMNIALKNAGLEEKGLFDGTSVVGFAPKDAATLAKALQKAAKTGEVFKVRGGYLDGRALNEKQVMALADLPPMPVMRAMLLGVLNAPATKLVRTLAEPARQMAAVLKAHAEKPAPAAG